MSTLFELSQAVRMRRTDMGFTQSSVAKLSGLSRTTINQIENGTIQDLSIKRATRLVDVLGLKMNVSTGHVSRVSSKNTALQKAAQTAGISYKNAIAPEMLRNLFLGEEIPVKFQPHVRAVLEEAPISLLASVVEQLHVENGIERRVVWAQMRSMARELLSYREVWL
jgi:transcriptional regulator with XRE-family HTH domain